MKTCLNCGADLLGKYQNKFCSHSCSATYTQIGRPSNNKGKTYKLSSPVADFRALHPTLCKICGKQIKHSSLLTVSPVMD